MESPDYYDWVKYKEFAIAEGDIVIAYSDGLDDNLYMEQITACVEPLIQNRLITSLGTAAECLAVKANILSKEEHY